MHKKRVLKKKVKILIIFVCFIMILFLPYFLINISLFGKNVINVDIGKKYSEPGYKGSFLGKNITNSIKVSNNLKNEKGTYFVKYSYGWLFYKKNVQRKVVVKDISSPKIELVGSNPYSLAIGEEYVEPGFSATDNVDGDLTKNVKVNSNVDSSKKGKYKVTYTVKDKSNNQRKVTRTVVVDKKSPTQMSIEEYTLDGYYDDYKLKETPDKGNEYFSKIVLVGDSNIKNLFLTGFVPGNQAWYLPCITSESYFYEKLYIAGREQILLLDAVEKYKPKIMILNLGTFSTAWISTDTFFTKSNELIQEIKKKSPETKLILSSIYPIRKGDNINDFNQQVINTYNYYILQMAEKYKLKFLNVQEVLKGDDGYGKDSYFIDDKFHFSDSGRTVLLKYIRTHALEEE